MRSQNMYLFSAASVRYPSKTDEQPPIRGDLAALFDAVKGGKRMSYMST